MVAFVANKTNRYTFLGSKTLPLDLSKARKEFGFEAKTEFREGLKKTIDWYEDNAARAGGTWLSFEYLRNGYNDAELLY